MTEEELAAFQQGMREIMMDFYRQMEYVPQPPLLNGTDLMTYFKLKPGPRFKELLEAVREAQHIGTVQDKKAALNLVSQLLTRETAKKAPPTPEQG